MTRCLIPALITCLVILSPLTSLAQTYEAAIRGNASATGNPNASSDRGAAVNFDFEAELKLGLLLDEPVISLRMRYDFTGGVVTTPTFEPGEDRFETRQLDLLPTEAAERLRLHDAKIRFTFDTGTGDAVEVIADAGYLKRAGEWSFNVPGSPDWDRLFIVPGSQFQDGEPSYYSEASARAIWASGLTLSAWDFEDIRLSQYDMHRWYAENNERARFHALQEAIRQVEKGISASYGYQFRGDDTDPLLDGMSSVATWLEVEARTGGFDGSVTYDKTQWQEVLARAETRFLKLASLPPDLAIGDNHEPYQRAVQNARQLLFQTGQAISSFKPEGVDVAALPAGHEAEFDGGKGTDVIAWPRLVNGSRETFEWANPDGSVVTRAAGITAAGPMIDGIACVGVGGGFNIVTENGDYVGRGRENTGTRGFRLRDYEEVTVSPDGYLAVNFDYGEFRVLDSATLEEVSVGRGRLFGPVYNGWLHVLHANGTKSSGLFNIFEGRWMSEVADVWQDFRLGHAVIERKNGRVDVIAPDETVVRSYTNAKEGLLSVIPDRIIECAGWYQACNVRDIQSGEIVGKTSHSVSFRYNSNSLIARKDGSLFIVQRKDGLVEGGSNREFAVFDLDLNLIEEGEIDGDSTWVHWGAWARGYHPHGYSCKKADVPHSFQYIPTFNPATGDSYYLGLR